MNFLAYLINYLPWVTWIAIPITIIVLIVLTWRESTRIQVAMVTVPTSTSQAEATPTQETVIREYSPQVRDKLDTLIQGGEGLRTEMQGRGFNTYRMDFQVQQWLDKIEHEVWNIVPQHATFIVDEQGDITPEERIRYQGWNMKEATLRIKVDRMLTRLREIRSQIRVVDTEGSQT